MMETNTDSKIQIYKGMIHYLLESTNYTLKNIADLSNSSIKNIRSIYYENLIPPNFASELHLVKLYHMILEVNINQSTYYKYLPLPKGYRQIKFN